MSEPYPPTSTMPPLHSDLGHERRLERERLDRERPYERDRYRERPASRLSEIRLPGFLTAEFVAYIVTVLGVLIASLAVGHTASHDDYFRADQAWLFITLLTIGFMLSRGLAKSHRDRDRDGTGRY